MAVLGLVSYNPAERPPHGLRLDQKKLPPGEGGVSILIWSNFAYKSAMNFIEQLYGQCVFAMAEYIHSNDLRLLFLVVRCELLPCIFLVKSQRFDKKM